MGLPFSNSIHTPRSEVKISMSYNRPPDPSQACTPRKNLPSRRPAATLTLVHRNQPLTMTAGFHDDGTLGEVFIDVAKSGTDLAHVAHDAAVAISLGLQHGVPIEAIQHAVARDSNGAPSSILGVVVDALRGAVMSSGKIEPAIPRIVQLLLVALSPGTTEGERATAFDMLQRTLEKVDPGGHELAERIKASPALVEEEMRQIFDAGRAQGRAEEIEQRSTQRDCDHRRQWRRRRGRSTAIPGEKSLDIAWPTNRAFAIPGKRISSRASPSSWLLPPTAG